MTDQIHYIKQHDDRPVIRGQVKIKGVPVDVSGAAVVFRIKAAAGTVTELDAEIEDAATGLLAAVFPRSVSAVAGNYTGEFVLSWLDGSRLTVPNDGYITIQVLPALA